MQPWAGAVGVHSASVRAGGAPRGTPAQALPRKIGVKKSRPRNPWRRAYPKSMKTVVFGFAVGFKKFCRSRENGFCSRALGPPRLAAGAGDRQSETLTNIYNLAPSGCFSKRFPLLTPAFSNPQAPACPFIRKDLFRLRACLRPLGRFRKSITTNPLLPDSGWDEWW